MPLHRGRARACNVHRVSLSRGNARDIIQCPPPLPHRQNLSSLSLFYLTPMDCLMTRPWCRQRGALRAALFLLPRAFYRHPLLIAVVPHRLRRESIYHHHQHHHHRHTTTVVTITPHRHLAPKKSASCMPAGFPRLNPRLTATNFSLAARARLENASGFGPATTSRAKFVSRTLQKLSMEGRKR